MATSIGRESVIASYYEATSQPSHSSAHNCAIGLLRMPELDHSPTIFAAIGFQSTLSPPLPRSFSKSDHAAMKSAAISGPMTKPLTPKSEMPPTVEISTT